MDKKKLRTFFETLGKRLEKPASIYLTGGIAAWLLGGIRPTEDVDFALKASLWDETARTLSTTAREQNIPVEFADDISRWGLIGLKEITRGAKKHGRWGPLTVYVLDPLCWSVGKLARYTQDDVADLEIVLKSQKVSWEKAVALWAQALKESPRSSEQALFIRKVEHFLKNSGAKIWGTRFQPEAAKALFRKLIK